MKKIAAVLASCLAVYVQADYSAIEDGGVTDGTGFFGAFFFDRHLPEQEQVWLVDYKEDPAEWWPVDSQPQAGLGTRYSLSIVEVAHTPENEVIHSFTEKHLNQHLAVFLQVSQAEQNNLQSHDYIGTGITLNNRWRAGDGIGLGIAHARSTYRNPQIYPDWESAEMAWELTYFGSVLDKLDAQTSVYYIQHPAQDANISDSIAAQLRVHFKF